MSRREPRRGSSSTATAAKAAAAATLDGRASASSLRVALVLFLLASASLPARQEPPGRRGSVPALPASSLEAMEEAPRRRVETMHAEVEALAEAGAPAAEVSEALGSLGQLYLAYELFDAAEAAFRWSVESSPDDARWPYYLGVVLETRGDLEGARDAFVRARELRPRDGANLVRLGNLLLDLDRADAAREAFEAAISGDPAAPAAAHHGLGKVAVLEDDLQAAVAHFEQALALDPEATVIHYQLGQAYRKLGDLERAREHLRLRGDIEARFPDPLGDQVAWLVLGTAFEVLQELASKEEDFSERDFMGFVQSHFGEVEGTAEQLREALRIRAQEARMLEPGSPAAEHDRRVRARIHYALGGLLVNRRLDQEAALHLRAALELEPELEDCRIRLGNILARAGDLEGAAAEYDQVLARNPDSTAALLRRGAARTSLGLTSGAIEDLERLRRLDPGHGEGVLRLATLLADTGDYARARRLYRETLALELETRELAAAHVELGKLEARLGSMEAAVAEYRSALELDPSLLEARFRLATTLGALARYDDAARVYRELIEAEPGHEGARLGEATALALAGREREARARLEEGLAALPESLGITHALARLLAAAEDPALRDGTRAVALATGAVQALSSLEHAETLAMALAQEGRFEDAVAVQERLVAEAEARGDSAVLPRLRLHLALYRDRHPCCGG